MRRPHEWSPATKRAVLAVVVVLAVAASTTAAVVGHDRARLPADVTVKSATVADADGERDRLRIRVANRGDEPIDPVVSTWRADSKFIIHWQADSGGGPIPPGETRVVRLSAPAGTLANGTPTHVAVVDGQRRATTTVRPEGER